MIIDLRPAFRVLPGFIRSWLPYSWYAPDWWALDNAIADLMVPNLKKLRAQKHGYPAVMLPQNARSKPTPGQEKRALQMWNRVLDEMIEGFELLKEDRYQSTPDGRGKVQRAFNRLASYWPNLWD